MTLSGLNTLDERHQLKFSVVGLGFDARYSVVHLQSLECHDAQHSAELASTCSDKTGLRVSVEVA